MVHENRTVASTLQLWVPQIVFDESSVLLVNVRGLNNGD